MEPFKLRTLSFLCCLSAISTTTIHAAKIHDLWDQTTNVPTLNQFQVINTPSSKQPVPAKAQLFVPLKKPLNNDYELRLRNAFIDAEGITHARYDEYYKNLRVVWADSIVHHKKTQSINGTIVTGIEKDLSHTNPTLSPEAAIAIARNDFAKQLGVRVSAIDFRLTTSELVIYPYVKDASNEPVAHLAYHVNFYAAPRILKKLHNPDYMIDANNGMNWHSYDNLKRAEAQVGTGPGGNTNPALTNGTYNYGSGAAPLAPFILIQTDTPAVGQCTWGNHKASAVSIGNATNNPSIFPILTNNEVNYPVVVIPVCSAGTGYANTNDNGEAPINGGQSPDNDVVFYGTQTYNLLAAYGIRNPSAPLGTTNPAVKFYVHLNSTDAFAMNAGCGGTPDACYNNQVVLGNGESQTYPQVGYDVVGHETAHIYVGLTSGLVYSNQSGGMNEAFADITGAALGAYIGGGLNWFPPISSTPPLNSPLGISFWAQGALDNRVYPALRYLYNPPLDGSSIANLVNYQQGMPVHYSSGIYNKAFYNLSTAIGNGSIADFQAVLRAYRFFIVANDAYWTSNIDFVQGSCGVILTADNPTYGGNNARMHAAINAFAAVGVHCKRALNKIIVT